MKRIRISWRIDWCFWIFHLPCTQFCAYYRFGNNFRPVKNWHSIVSWRCFSPINLFLKKLYYRHLLRKESEFHCKSTGAFGFSIYRAHKFLWRDLYRYFTCIYYERFLWYGHANNLARLLNEKGKLSVLVENFMANRLVFLDFPSTVHTILCLL